MSERSENSGGPIALRAVVIAGVTIVALALRAWDVGDKSIWLDEAWSWRAARLPLADMVDWTAQDRHPPLYYAVLHFWVDVFGDSETVLRLPSALAGAASAAVLAYVGWRTGGVVLAVIAGGLLALHPTHVEFAQEARMYPLMGFLSLAATVALAAVVDKPSLVRASLYAALAAAAMYTHYSGVLLLLLHAALIAGYASMRWRTDGPRIAALGYGALAVVALAYIPWYGHLAESVREGVAHISEPSWTLVDLVFSALFGLQRASDYWLAIAIPLAAFGVWGVARRFRDPYVVCVAALALVPVMQLLVSWLRTPVLDVRQASPYIAGFSFLLALGIFEAGRYVAEAFGNQRLRGPAAVAGAAGIGVLMFVACLNWYSRGPREEWRQVAADVESAGTVYIWRGYISEPMRYYTDQPLTPIAPNVAPSDVAPGATGAAVFSHNTAGEAEAILRSLRKQWTVGEAVTYTGITRYPLQPRAATSSAFD